nr:SHOCT domain-containing protein [Microbacterium sp.]
MAYLFALFAIIGDLFRDRKLNGWAKAIWIFFLIFFPIITALIYLIARGRGMGERQVAAAQQYKAAHDDYIKQVAGTSPADQIAQAKSLLDSGAISPAEYEALKAKALA